MSHQQPDIQSLIKDALDRQAAEQGGPVQQIVHALIPLATLFCVHALYLGIRYLSRLERRLASSHHRSRTPSRDRR